MVIILVSGTGAFLLEGGNRYIGLGILGVLVLPYLISGPAWGIALIAFWNEAGWRGWVYDHSAIAAVACVGKYTFVGWLGFGFALRSVRQEYKDAAQVLDLPLAQAALLVQGVDQYQQDGAAGTSVGS